MERKALLIIIAVWTILSCEREEIAIKDFDGNIYHTVKIGSQTWMVENLKVTHYNDGSPILNISNINDWVSNDSVGGYCWYNNDLATNKEPYGALYNFAAINSDKLCPKGWHIPDNNEWQTLIDYLGGDSISAPELKESGTLHWRAGNGSNNSGFTALPGGYRWVDFYNLTYAGYYWSSSSTAMFDWCFSIYIKAEISSFSEGNGLSVRCIKD